MGLLSRIIKRIKHILAVSENLTDGGVDKFRVIRSGFLLLLAYLLGLKDSSPVKLDLKKDGKTFNIKITSVTDFSILYDLFIVEEYGRAKGLQQVSTILDFGSNIGISAIYFHLLFPNAQIHCFEPDKVNYQLLCENIEQFKNITANNMAVGQSDGEVDFYETPERGASSSVLKRSEHQLSTKIKMSSLETVLNNLDNQVDLLKFDIEGAEFELFNNANNLQRIETFIGELHTDLIECSVQEFCNLFSEFNTEVEEIASDRYIFFASKK